MLKTSRWRRWTGRGAVEEDLAPYRAVAAEVARSGEALEDASDDDLRALADALRARAREGASPDDLLVEAFALAREAADRVMGLRPFDVQVVAAVALHRGRVAEVPTGEGKTLAAVLPAFLHALAGRGVHVLTFNDYLARRDAAWMGPLYHFLGLSVGVVQEGMGPDERRAAYAADVTYATAKEAGFDFLRMHLARTPDERVHRPFHYAIVDEADSLLIDEARVPLVIAGERAASDTSPYRLAEVVRGLAEGADWETDEHGRNAQLSERGVERVEAVLASGSLHDPRNYLLLTEVNQALHARALLHRDVDYLVRDGRIELVDEFTGRVVDDRRWPDGLQAALEAKEGLPVQPGGHILGSVTLPDFLRQYPRLAGMTATARPAADELLDRYGLRVVPIRPNRPCVRRDLPDLVFTHREAKDRALVDEIARAHEDGRPVLVGTGSVAESERLAARLRAAGVACRVLNAKQDEAEAEVVAQAGAPGAVTISTNMAGRGTDIRLGGADEAERARVVALGGLYVIGTGRHESRRIDDQLRGRAGRQGDPGTSRFFVSLEDDLPVRFGIDALVPPRLRPAPQDAPVEHPVVRREVERVQRIAEGQNREIRQTLARYAALVEKQRTALHAWRTALLLGEAEVDVWARERPERHATLVERFGEDAVARAERAVTLHHLDEAWADHLAFVAEVREGVHLVGIGGRDPLTEFHGQIAAAFEGLRPAVEARVAATLDALAATEDGLDLAGAGVRGPSATWTYLVNDRVMTDLQQLLFGYGSGAFAAGAMLTAWPLLAGWALWRRLTRR